MKTGLIFLSAFLMLTLRLPVLAADKAEHINYVLLDEKKNISVEKQSIPEMKLSEIDFGETIALFSSPSPELTLQKDKDAKQTIPSLLGGYNMLGNDSNEVALKAVDRNISLFSKTMRERFSLWLSRSGKYMEMMQEILRDKDIPENIVFLSLIESGFSTHAYSVAHAAGPWQFIASTAKRYGLEINWWKDERRDPIKSTSAAASYLRDLYKMFGSWNLAMAAYNAGEGRIQRAMKSSNADNYWALLGTSHIRPETKDYVPKFIAASLIASNPGDFGFDEIEYHDPLSFDEVELKFPVDLSVAAECAGTTLEEIKRLNPELRRWCTPPDVSNYSLKIPEGTKEQFLEALSSIPEDKRFTIDRYTVKKGQTFGGIAKETGIPVSVILSLNSMEKVMPLKAGSTIYLPPKGLYSLDHYDRALIKKAKTKAPPKKAAAKKVSGKKKTVKTNKS
jgi:membrane-bound lytic murein transglycosylase D